MTTKIQLSSSELKLQDSPADLWLLYARASDVDVRHAMFISALAALQAIKGKQSRPAQLELASALIVGDALRRVKALEQKKAYQDFLEKYQIKSRDASLYSRLAEAPETIYAQGLAGLSLSDITTKLKAHHDSKFEADSEFIHRLLRTPATPVEQQCTDRVRSVYARDDDDDDDDQVETIRAIARNGGLF